MPAKLDPDHIVDSMIASGDPAGRAIQTTQIDYRVCMVRQWAIPEGSRVLEMACGQGDMTAVLAHAVGSGGHVTAVDIADPTYGAPVNLGDSMAYLTESAVGERITARFSFDVLDPTNSFAEDAFDFVVLVHGAWYFADLAQLEATLRWIRPWAGQLLFTEWDMEPVTIEQVPHLLSVIIQGQIETYKPESEANIRTPFSREMMHALLDRTGWTIEAETRIDTAGLQDAGWELDMAGFALEEMTGLAIPDRTCQWITSRAEVMRSMAAIREVRPLPSYSVKAIRA
jgi:SAM-dependent methyltransferase